MNTIRIVIALFLAATLARAEAPTPASVGLPFPEVDFPFPIGETLTYDIYWGWVGVGQSTATTAWEWDAEGNRWVLLIRFRTVSNHVIAKLYPVDDVIESRVDPLTLRPVSLHVNLKEGRHRRDETTRFNWETRQASFEGVKNGRARSKTFEIREDTRDIVSFMYFMRETEFAERSTYDFVVMADEKLYDLTVHSRTAEDVNLKDYGKVKSLRLDPKAAFDGVFVRKGEMTLWVSQDERRILTKAEIDTPFANVRVLLRKVEGPGAEDWNRKDPKPSGRRGR